MLTPFDWQEGIGHRAQFVEAKLAQGMPVVAVSLDEGILMLTYRRQSGKIFEIYDQLGFAAIGQQSDVEALRVAAIDFAHQEGFNRSEQDVTIQRVVTALSASVKRAFGDFSLAPVVARSLFAEVCATPAEDAYAVLDYDGDYTTRRGFAYVAGTDEEADALKAGLQELKVEGRSAKQILPELRKVWMACLSEDGQEEFEGKYTEEAALLERGQAHVNRFRMLNSA